jgi:hypothetical protein
MPVARHAAQKSSGRETSSALGALTTLNDDGKDLIGRVLAPPLQRGNHGHVLAGPTIGVGGVVDAIDARSVVLNLLNAAPAAIQRRLQEAQPRRRQASRVDSCDGCYTDPLDGFTVPGYPGLMYNEHAFHYLLDVERKRAADAQRPFLLLVLECADAHGDLVSGRVSGPARLLPIVHGCVRETDFVGWYSHGTVVGAALMQDGRRNAQHASSVIRERLIADLRSALPAQAVSRLRLHLYEVAGDDERRIE